MGWFNDDIVGDLLRRVVEAAGREGLGFSDQMARQIETQVRSEWGGGEHYVKTDSDARRAARDDKIYALYWDEGLRDIRMLAQRFGLSPRQVRRIVNR